jgi:hypothetical protein
MAAVPMLVARQRLRGRVDAILSVADPCEARAVASADLERASDEQRARATARASECEELRKREADAKAAARAKEEKARADDQRVRDRETQCAALADHLTGGTLEPADGALAPGKEPLLVRVAKGALAPEDMLENDLPCADTPAGAKVADVFAAALLKSPFAWAHADDVSERVAKVLIAHQGELSTTAKFTLLGHADQLVKRALTQKSAEAADRATRICKLKDDLEIRGAHYCPALAKLRAQGKL